MLPSPLRARLEWNSDRCLGMETIERVGNRRASATSACRSPSPSPKPGIEVVGVDSDRRKVAS